MENKEKDFTVVFIALIWFIIYNLIRWTNKLLTPLDMFILANVNDLPYKFITVANIIAIITLIVNICLLINCDEGILKTIIYPIIEKYIVLILLFLAYRLKAVVMITAGLFLPVVIILIILESIFITYSVYKRFKDKGQPMLLLPFAVTMMLVRFIEPLLANAPITETSAYDRYQNANNNYYSNKRLGNDAAALNAQRDRDAALVDLLNEERK